MKHDHRRQTTFTIKAIFPSGDTRRADAMVASRCGEIAANLVGSGVGQTIHGRIIVEGQDYGSWELAPDTNNHPE